MRLGAGEVEPSFAVTPQLLRFLFPQRQVSSAYPQISTRKSAPVAEIKKNLSERIAKEPRA